MLDVNSKLKITSIDTCNINKSNSLSFYCGGTEMIRLEENGDIYVRGKLAENDKDVVEGLRNFLRAHRCYI